MQNNELVPTGASLTAKVERMLALAHEVRISIAALEAQIGQIPTSLQEQIDSVATDLQTTIDAIGGQLDKVSTAFESQAVVTVDALATGNGAIALYFRNSTGQNRVIRYVADHAYFNNQNTARRNEISTETTIRQEQFKGLLTGLNYTAQELDIALNWPWGVEAENLSHTFEGNADIVNMPYISTGRANNLSWMFRDCTNMEALPPLDTSNNTDFGWFCSRCKKLVSVPLFDTSAATDMSAMFEHCAFSELPAFDTSNCRDMKYMLQQCANLKEIPPFNVEKVENMDQFARACTALEYVPDLNTKRCREFRLMFYNDTSLQRIDGLNFASAISTANMFVQCTALTHLRIYDLGTTPSSRSFDFRSLTSWGDGSEENRQSLVDSLTAYSFDRAAAGYDTCTIQLAAAAMARLTADEIAAITAKGYTLTA